VSKKVTRTYLQRNTFESFSSNRSLLNSSPADNTTRKRYEVDQAVLHGE
jgi:hypothetical protein